MVAPKPRLIRSGGPSSLRWRPIPYQPPAKKNPARLPYRAPGLAQRSSGYVRLFLRAPEAALDTTAALELTYSLHASGIPLSLFVSVDGIAVRFGVICRASDVLAVKRAILGACPAWDLELAEEPLPDARLPRYIGSIIKAERPDHQPIKCIEAFARQQVDPLGSLLAAAYPLRSELSERVEFRLLVRPARPQRLDQVYREELTYTFSGLAALLCLLFGMPTGPYPSFEPKTQQEYEERLFTQPVFETIVLIILSGHDRAALRDKADSITKAIRNRFYARGGPLELQPWRFWSGPDLTADRWRDHPVGLLLPHAELASWFHAPSQDIPRVQHLNRPISYLPPALTSSQGMRLGYHRQFGQNVEVRLGLADAAKHTAILGISGMGKSVLALNLLRQALQIRPEVAAVFYDPNRDGAVDATARTDRVDWDRTYFFDLGDAAWPPGIPLLTPEPGVPLARFVENRYETMKLIFADASWSESRMADLLYALTSTLASIPEATLWDAVGLLRQPSSPAIRAHVKDPATLEWWADYQTLSDAARREYARPAIVRLRRLFRSEATRNLICRTSGPNIPGLIESGARVYISVAGEEIRASATILLELLLSQLYLGLDARLTREGPRRRVLVGLDEGARFRGPTLALLARESRKLGAALLILSQYVSAWPEELAEAVMNNVSTVVAFRLGHGDARRLASLMAPYTAEQIETLNPYECLVRLSVGDQTQPAFDMKTYPLDREPDPEAFEYIRDRTRRLFCQPKAEVDALFTAQTQASDQPGSGWEIFDVDALT
jgi:DNA helicase HerA-like ATPase